MVVRNAGDILLYKSFQRVPASTDEYGDGFAANKYINCHSGNNINPGIGRNSDTRHSKQLA